MNAIKITMLAATLLSAGAALADDGARTRAQIVAEVHAAQAAGLLHVLNGEDSGSFHLARQGSASALTRAQVAAQVAAAQRAGEIGLASSESGGSFHVAAVTAGGRSRAEVVAEMLAARDSGEMAAYVGEDSGSAWLARADHAARVAAAGQRAVLRTAAGSAAPTL